MTFGTPAWLWGLFLIPLLIALFISAERRGLERLHEFVSVRLLSQLAGTVNRPRRLLKFGLQLLGLSFVLLALAQPRWGYTFEDVKRKGLDLLIAVDISRSMLSNDVQPNRLERVKLAVQDLISQLQGDRVGLIAFAGSAAVQAPLTIDYDAVVEALNDLDTKTVPEGGTNISGAIKLVHVVFGKTATGNRALILFTDGEELEGDAVKSAQAAAGEGVRIFTVGVGTPQGSLIPIIGENGETAFVKDSGGQVVKSKLDEKRLREIAQATGGFYLHLENGPRTMRQLYDDGLSRMKAAEIDARLSRRPIERYEWPLSLALIALTLSILIGERKRARERIHVYAPAKATAATAALFILLCQFTFGAPAGLDAYRNGQFEDAYSQFQQTLQSHPQSRAEDKLQFDSGAAAYKLKDYNRALESFSQALLSPDIGLQSKSHYNLGNTLYERGEAQKSDGRKLSDWTNALDHYEQTLKLEPQNKDAKENYDYVKKKIEELKNRKQPEQRPSPSPQPPQKNKRNQQNQQQQEQQQQGQGEQQKEDQQRSQDQQSQGESRNRKDQQQEKQKGESQTNNEQQQHQSNQASPSPSPSEQNQEQSGEGVTPSVTPAESPQKKFAGQVKGAGEEKSQKPEDKNAQAADAEAEKKGEMSERQALALIESMKDEEARVQLDERKATRHVYNDW